MTTVLMVAVRAVALVRRSASGTLAVSLGLQLLSAVLVGAQLYVIKSLVTGLVRLAQDAGAPVSHVLPSFAVLLGVTLTSGIVTALLDRQQRLLSELVARDTLDQIIDVAGAVDFAKFEDPDFHDRLQRATAAATFRPVQMITALMGLLLAVLTSLVILVALATLEPLLVPLVLVASVPLLLTTLRNSRDAYVFEYGMTTHARERLHLLELLIDRESAKEIRIFRAGAYLRTRYDALSDERIARMASFLRARMRIALVGTSATSLGSAIALGSLIWLLASGRLGVASAAAAAVAMQVLGSRLTTAIQSIGQLVETSMFIDDLEDFLATQVRTSATPTASAPAPLPFERLELDHVTFRYPGTERPVLEDVSMEIGRGEVVALVGENGSGKTSLVKLVCRLYEADEGSVRWNGVAVGGLDPERLRSSIAVLFQDFVRYHLSVQDNVLLGRADVAFDEGRFADAARRSGLETVVDRLPEGVQARLGREFERGTELSGGQWQRLALARSFYRGGELLVLDEPTAALDPRAEYELFAQMRDMAAGTSVLLISHRFANVRMADRIYVLDDGRVTEVGDHESLMAKGGLYAELFDLQAAAYLREAGGPDG